MFREMRRFKQQVSEEECNTVLNDSKRAVLSVNGEDGYPYCMPVNFVYDEDVKEIYIHGAVEGSKLDAIEKNAKVCFTTWGDEMIPEGEWASYLTSVIVFGKAEISQDIEFSREKILKLAYKYFPEDEEDDLKRTMEKHFHRTKLIKIHIEHMTGKRVHEK